ncbi:MAG TPA: DUF2889 domain-containing protein [Novosphingobium sp.]|nr:DUF2889 domain-containing protein [Novosphingobium sp.]
MHDDPFRLPGFRRTTRIEPRAGAVAAMMEDDMHAMAVILRHDGQRLLRVEPDQQRAPWNTCPGAEAKLVATFTGLPLGEVSARRERTLNCTHLHDLAVLAAAHAQGRQPVLYEMAVSDPVDACRVLEIRRDGAAVWRWVERDGRFVAPDAIAGRGLFDLRDWIASLPAAEREAARLLQTAGLIAHGRTLPMEQQSDATAIPPNCHTFQPEQARMARRIRAPLDFSGDGPRLLAGLAPGVLARLQAAD